MGESGEGVGVGDEAVIRKIPAEEDEDDDIPEVSRRGWAILFTLMAFAALGAWRTVEILLGLV